MVIYDTSRSRLHGGEPRKTQDVTTSGRAARSNAGSPVAAVPADLQSSPRPVSSRELEYCLSFLDIYDRVRASVVANIAVPMKRSGRPGYWHEHGSSIVSSP